MMLYALPRSFGWKRLITGPASARASETNSVFRTGVVLCSLALATAERMTFSTMTAARFLEKRSIASASSTSRPRTRSSTSRAFRGAMRANLCFASNAILHLMNPTHARFRTRGYVISQLSCRRCARTGLGGLLTAVTSKNSRRRKLAELVADHVFLNEHLQELVPVVNLKRVAHKFRDDRAGPGPGLNGLLGLVVVQARDLFVKLLVDVRTFFCTAAHVFSEDPGNAGAISSYWLTVCGRC